MSTKTCVAIATPDTETIDPEQMYSTAEVVIPDGQSLATLQRLVDGYVECFDLQHPKTGEVATMWFNDSGKMIGLEVNPMATAVALIGGWQGYEWNGPLQGQCVVTGFDPESGETLTLSPDWIELIAIILEKIPENTITVIEV